MSESLDNYLRLLSRISPSAAALNDLTERFQFVVSGQFLTLPQSTHTTIQNSINQIQDYARSPEYLQYLDSLSNSNKNVTDVCPKNFSVLMAYDFHVGKDGIDPKLIEINTNASGYLLSALLCESKLQHYSNLREKLFKSFAEEFALFNGLSLPKDFSEACQIFKGRKIAIVDQKITEQKMYVEFLVYRDLFNQMGASCDLVELADLEPKNYDLIYNRTTDFYFASEESKKVREAYLSQSTCITPNPRQYFLLADKHRLTHFAEKNISPCLLKTSLLKNMEKEVAWAERKKLFFKPANMFGGRGAYRGSSLSMKVFDRIYAEDYLAQEYSAPGVLADRKFDLRFYVYKNEIQHVVARLYSGQVTGFQVAGDGFAPVVFE